MRTLLVLLALGTLAQADPLPDGLRFERGTGARHADLFVARGKERGRIGLDQSGVGDLGAARYDRKTRIATLEYTRGCGQKDEKSWPVDALRALVENGAGYRLLAQGKLADAIARLSEAVKLDPTLVIARTNLASAHVRARDTVSALKVLAPLIRDEPIALYAKVVLDADLAVLTETPELGALRAKSPGSARLTDVVYDIRARDKSALVATSGELVATTRMESSWGADCYDDVYLTVLRATDGALLAELPIGGNREDAAGRCNPTGAREARVLMANRFLSDLGFEPASVERAAVERDENDARKAYFPVAKLGIVDGDRLRVLRGNTTLASVPYLRGHLGRAAYVPRTKSILATWIHSAHEGCEGMDTTGVELIRVP